MPKPSVQLFRGQDLEGRRDDEGFMEVLDPGRSGVPNVWFARFGTERGASIPPHHHTSNSIACLVRGRAAFRFGDDYAERVELSAGDYVVVPSGVLHMEETIGDEPAEFVVVRDGGGGETVYVDPQD
jgi:uncharacterized RmlC-like cupin family protein